MAQIDVPIRYYNILDDLEYPDYINTKVHFDSLKRSISRDASNIVGCIEKVGERLSVELGGISETQGEIRDQLGGVNKNLEGIDKSLHRIDDNVVALGDLVKQTNTILDWGFTSVLAELGAISSGITELIGVAKTPDKTWAYEKYSDAVDATRRKFFREALEFVDQAIGGDGVRNGYSLEQKFHFLKGMLHLGSPENNSKEIVDLEQSIESFNSSARYAEFDQPRESAKALASAGWAHYCNGDRKEAEDKFENAIELDENCAEAHYNLGRIFFLEDEQTKSEFHLVIAFDLRVEFCAIFSEDQSLNHKKNSVVEVLQRYRIQLAEKFQSGSQSIVTRLEGLSRIPTRLVAVANFNRTNGHTFVDIKDRSIVDLTNFRNNNGAMILDLDRSIDSALDSLRFQYQNLIGTKDTIGDAAVRKIVVTGDGIDKILPYIAGLGLFFLSTWIVPLAVEDARRDFQEGFQNQPIIMLAYIVFSLGLLPACILYYYFLGMPAKKAHEEARYTQKVAANRKEAEDRRMRNSKEIDEMQSLIDKVAEYLGA